MTSKEIETQALLDHKNFVDKILDEDRQINLNKIKNESKVRKLWRRTGNIPEIAFVK